MIDPPRRRAAHQRPNRLFQTFSNLIPPWNYGLRSSLLPHWTRLSLDAVRYALYLQRKGLRASFVLAVVQEPVYTYEMMLPADPEVFDHVTGAVGARALMDAEALFETAGLAFEREIVSGDPALKLVEIAHGAWRSAVLGSVATRVASRCSNALLLIQEKYAFMRAQPIKALQLIAYFHVFPPRKMLLRPEPASRRGGLVHKNEFCVQGIRWCHALTVARAPC